MAAGGSTSHWNGGCSAVPESSAVVLKQGITMSVDWNRDEQSLLEELLAKYASESTVMRYAKIAMHLKDKTVRDVALRCRWMTEKNSDKQRKPSSNAINHANGLPNAQLSTSVDNDDDISIRDWCRIRLNTDIGGVEGQLLEQNAQFLERISANFPAFKVQENMTLLWQTRSNFAEPALMNNVNYVPEMKRMPPLSLKINDELFNSILPQPSMPIGF